MLILLIILYILPRQRCVACKDYVISFLLIYALFIYQLNALPSLCKRHLCVIIINVS